MKEAPDNPAYDIGPAPMTILSMVAMKKLLIGALLSALCLSTAGAAAAQDKTSPPPSALLEYSIRASIQGLSLEGSGTIDWQVSTNKYQLQFNTRAALTGVLLSEKSEGTVERRGLQPSAFHSKRFRKEAVTVMFDRQAGNINFPGDNPSLKIEGGEQDRISVLWQLLSMVRATPARFAPGSPWKFLVIGHRGAEPWTFSVDSKQRLRTALGEVDSLHLIHLPPENSGAPRVDIWLAPSLDWFPVRLRFSEPNGDSIEQTIAGIKKG